MKNLQTRAKLASVNSMSGENEGVGEIETGRRTPDEIRKGFERADEIAQLEGDYAMPAYEPPRQQRFEFDFEKAARWNKALERKLLRAADRQLKELDAKADYKDETGVIETAKRITIQSVDYYAMADELLKNPVMHQVDYQKRNTTIAELVNKLQDKPKSAGYEDLANILKAEKDDLEERKIELEQSGITPVQQEWIRLNLVSLDASIEAADCMKNGEKLMDDDPRSIELNTYVRALHDALEIGERIALERTVDLDKKINRARNSLLKLKAGNDPQPLLNKIDKFETEKSQYLDSLKDSGGSIRAIGVFKAFDDKTLKYGEDNIQEEVE